jgi:hypothetical protein
MALSALVAMATAKPEARKIASRTPNCVALSSIKSIWLKWVARSPA